MAQPNPADGELAGRPSTATSPTRAWVDWWQGRDTSADAVLAAASRQGFVLACAQLPELGISRSTSRTRVRRGSWSAPAAGVVAPLDVVDGDDRFVVERRRHALLTAAGVLRNPRLVATARSAAVLHGLPTMRVPTRAELLSPDTRGLGNRTMTHRYRAAIDPCFLGDWYGVCTTDAARTVVDLARHSRWDGLMAADAALCERLTTRAAMAAAIADEAGWPGVIRAREVLELADPRAESPLESITRLRMNDDGLPVPELQYEIGGYWVDFCWPARRLVLEADGLKKYAGEALHAEKRRERHLRRYGYRVERVTWDDVIRQWPATLRWLSAALAA